jgi:hypothetical protein
MSVIKVQEGFTGQEGKDSTHLKERTRVFLVEVDDPTDEMDTVLAGNPAPGSGEDILPQRGDPYPGALSSYSNSVVVSLDARRTASRLFWIVTAQYSSQQGQIITDNPLDDPWEVRWSHESIRKVLEKSVTSTTSLTNLPTVQGFAANSPIATSAGQRFYPGIEVEEVILVCSLVTNRSTYDVAQAKAFINTMNNNVVTICGHAAPKWSAKLTAYDGEEVHSRGGYWRVNYQVSFRDALWVTYIPNDGTKCLKSGLLIDVMDTKGQPFKDAQHILAADGTYNPASPPAYNEVVYGDLKAMAFSNLNLPVVAPSP